MNIKTFTIHSVRNVLAVVIALGLGYVAYTVNPTSVAPTKVEAGASQNVSGWAWSENIGWISLNSFDCDADKNGFVDSGFCGGNNTSTIARDYGVNISPLSGTGIFSGYAWSENVGWISFNSGELTGCPSGACNAQVDWVSGKVTGWARVLSQTGDGWIKLGGDGLSWGGSACTGVSDHANTNRCNYGVKIDPATGKFSGYAWSSDSVGWIDFAPASAATTNPARGPTAITDCTISGCTGGLACNPITKLCIPPNGSCSTSADCGGGQQCNPNGTCVYAGGSCATNADCLTGESCSAGGVCVPPSGSCTSDAQCAGGQICNTTTSTCYDKPAPKFWQF